MKNVGKRSQRGEKMAKDMTLGKAYVQIVPSAEGIQGSLEKVMSNEGASSGKSFSSAFSKAAVAGISTAAIGKAISASITEGAALEQSLGGVETLFKDNADKVVAYADQAYRTAGVSANAYMEQVTSFSATLLQGLGGDTEKAAEYANTAMVDMSDNANKFGTDMQSIQNAYQGFAKQNYTMLDNLKLGYGGTQEEMARLINDSGVLGDSIKVTAETVKDVPFADVISAIHTIQGNLGVTGTTAKEAATTFSGSMQSMRSAASNLLGHLSTGTGDIDEDVKALSETTATFGGNLAEMLSKINKGLSDSEGAIGDVYTGVKDLAVITAAFFATMKFTAAIKGLQGLNAAMIQGKLLAKAMNAEMALMANAPGLIVAAFAAAGMLAKSAIDKQTDAINEVGDEYDGLSDKIKKTVDEASSLTSEAHEMKNRFAEATDGAEEQAASLEAMTDKLYKLNDAEKLSNEDKAEMQALVSQLNESVPELNLVLDEQTGHIINQRNEVDKLVDSYTKQAKAQAAQEHLAELYGKLYEAQELYNGAQEKYLAAQKSGVYNGSEYMGKVSTAYIDAADALHTIEGEIDKYTGIVRESAAETDTAAGSLDGYGRAADNAAQAVDKTFTVSQDSFDKISKIAQNYADAAGNIGSTTQTIADSLDIFSAFNWDDELNADEMISNLESNLNAMDWGTNGITKLKDRADELGVAIDDNLLAKLEEMGPDAANQISVMCNMTEGELQQYSDLYGEYYSKAQEKATNELDRLKEESAAQIQDILENAEHQAVPLTDVYNYLAECAVSGFEGGVVDGTDSLRAAGREIYFAVEEGYKEASETRSPSRAMRRLGKFLPEGAALGIEDGMDIVRTSAANMAKAAISSAEPLRASAPATDIDIGTVRRAAAQYDYSGTQAAVSGKADSGKPAIINLNINGQTFAQATADYIDLANGATLALKERGVAR